MNGSVRSIVTVISFAVQTSVPDEPPRVGILRPLPGMTVQEKDVIEGWASDNTGIDRVEVRLNGGKWNRVVGRTAWYFPMDRLDAREGWNSLDARAYDGDTFSDVTSIQVYAIPGPSKVQEESFIFVFIIVVLIAISIVLSFYIIHLRKHG